MDFTLIDAGVAVIVVLSALLAYSRGLVRESMAIAGWAGAAVLAFIFADQVEPLVRQIPVIGGFIGDSCQLSVIFAFFAVFAASLVIVSIFTPLFSSIIQRSALGGLDQGLGFLFGVARGVLLVAIAFYVYDTLLSTQDIEMIDTSRSHAVFSQFLSNIGDKDPQAAVGWLEQQYEQLVGKCGVTEDASTLEAPTAAPSE